jgi:hypothetical protein
MPVGIAKLKETINHAKNHKPPVTSNYIMTSLGVADSHTTRMIYHDISYSKILQIKTLSYIIILAMGHILDHYHILDPTSWQV